LYTSLHRKCIILLSVDTCVVSKTALRLYNRFQTFYLIIISYTMLEKHSNLLVAITTESRWNAGRWAFYRLSDFGVSSLRAHLYHSVDTRAKLLYVIVSNTVNIIQYVWLAIRQRGTSWYVYKLYGIVVLFQKSIN